MSRKRATLRTPWSCRFASGFTALWLGWILLAATKQLIRFFPPPDAPLNGDAQWTYLPNARALLKAPWDFLTTSPDSYHVAPLGYVWAAVWGADAPRIQLAHCVLFLACVLLMWRCATRLGGRVAGVIATSLLVYHPELVSFIPQVLTEALYLFGLMLFTAAAVEYVLSDRHRGAWLGLAATGLTITLLSRPVLQIFAVLGCALAIGATWYLAHRTSSTNSATERWRRVINRPLCAALFAALLLPAAVIIKNGVYFGVWGLGTGAGSGLYYGVSPNKMGMEPVFSGFDYDAGIVPLAADPTSKGNPLSAQGDEVNKRVALDIIQNTSLRDNAAFFAHKLQAWLFYSTPELHTSYKLRSFRIFEWLAIGFAIGILLPGSRKRPPNAGLRLAGPTGREAERWGICVLLLLLVLAMAFQLTPVLYNTRYNAFFMGPWLLLLAGVGAALVIQMAVQVSLPLTARALLTKNLFGIFLVALMALLPPVLTSYAERHETWAMDPYRPGPTAVMLDGSAMGPVKSVGATEVGQRQWRLDTRRATLVVPFEAAVEKAALSKPLEALWRVRLAVHAEDASEACQKLRLTVSPPASLGDWYDPEPILTLRVDGSLHTYAINGNDVLRPKGSGSLYLTFDCPPGTTVTWAGAELLRSTMPEAARALIQRGEPIDPYRHSEPF